MPSSVPPSTGWFSGGYKIGGAGSSSGSTKPTDLLNIEYISFRIPAEELSQKFRNGQKEMDRAAHAVKKAVAMITEKTKNATEPVEKETLQRNFEYLMKTVDDARAALEKSCDGQLGECAKLKIRTEKLIAEFEMDPTCMTTDQTEFMTQQRYARYCMWHLLRCGYIKSAKALLRDSKMEGHVDVDIFERIHKIECDLARRNTKSCLEWIRLHNHRLKKIGSRLEIAVRQLDVSERLMKRDLAGAIEYAKKHITPIAKDNHMGELRRTVVAIMDNTKANRRKHPEFYAKDRYKRCAQFFVTEVYRVYDIHGETALQQLVECGLACRKTPLCHADKKIKKKYQKCMCCRPDVWPIAENLPYAHLENSRILCSMTNTLCNDDDNIPYLFPTGHVFGLKAVNDLRREDNMIWDPVRELLMKDTEALRLYFL